VSRTVLSERTIEFLPRGPGLVPAFAGGDERELTLAGLQLDRARAWLADFIERRLSPAIPYSTTR
jgi:hypothetical protein